MKLPAAVSKLENQLPVTLAGGLSVPTVSSPWDA